MTKSPSSKKSWEISSYLLWPFSEYVNLLICIWLLIQIFGFKRLFVLSLVLQMSTKTKEKLLFLMFAWVLQKSIQISKKLHFYKVYLIETRYSQFLYHRDWNWKLILNRKVVWDLDPLVTFFSSFILLHIFWYL